MNSSEPRKDRFAPLTYEQMYGVEEASDQMTWVQRMNSLRNRAEEIVVNSLVYS